MGWSAQETLAARHGIGFRFSSREWSEWTLRSVSLNRAWFARDVAFKQKQGQAFVQRGWAAPDPLVGQNRWRNRVPKGRTLGNRWNAVAYAPKPWGILWCVNLFMFSPSMSASNQRVVPLWHPYGRLVWYLALASYECLDEVEKKQEFRTCAISSWTICDTTLVFSQTATALLVCFRICCA